MSGARRIAADILAELEKSESYSNLAIDAALKNAEITKADSAFVTRLVYGVTERKLTLDYYIDKLSKKPSTALSEKVQAALRMAIYQIVYMDKVPNSAAVNESVNLIKKSREKYAAGFVNAVLRNFLREQPKLPSGNSAKALSVKYSCPQWFITELTSYIGQESTERFLENSLEPAPTFLRVNTLKTTVNELKEQLFKDGIETEKTALRDEALCSIGFGSVRAINGFSNGLFYIQDISAQTAISVLGAEKGDRVLDVCASPGGKSISAAMHMQNVGEIVSCDIHKHRVKLIEDNAKRLGVSCIKAIVNDATVYNESLGKFGKIICDVPCSGFGVIRRKPEIKYKPKSDLTNLPDLQYNILENSARYLKTGGTLLYSTCTLRREENEAVVERFLKNHSEYLPQKTEVLGTIAFCHRLMPSVNGGDGFFFAVIRKER